MAMLARPVVHYRYWNLMRNCGDAVTSYILDRVFDLEPVVAPHAKPHLSAVGSIIGFANENSVIWGSGILGGHIGLPKLAPSQFRAVRGAHTLRHLRENGIDVPDVPLGDPGIFASDLLAAEMDTLPTRYRIAVVPHHSAMHDPAYSVFRDRDDVCIVDMRDDGLKPLYDIAMSEVVISHSLHGLIFAEALGKPSVWVSHSDEDDWRFKFDDWYSTTQEPQRNPILLKDLSLDTARECRLAHHTIDKDALKRCFPQELVEKTETYQLTYLACRQRRFAAITLPFSDVLTSISNIASKDEAAGEYQWHLQQRHRNAFNLWCEPSYGFHALLKNTIDPAVADAVTVFLDWHLQYEYAYFAPKTEPIPDNAQSIRIAGRTLHYIEGDVDRAVAIMLRPNGWFSFGSPRVTFFDG